ncbi:MAG: hypothetical protein ACM3XM_10545 [Mycobacterium leprae]
MAVLRVPKQFDTISEAVDHAQPRDTILVSDGTYREAVTLSKDALRIMADGGRVVLNGSGRLETGFFLQEVSGVTIEGFAIRNFTGAAIRAQRGSGHRLAQNRIARGEGIDLQGSSRNLIWRNVLRGVCIGVSVTGHSVAHHVLDHSIVKPS